jgi:ADP-ribose pyrophosphatase YjhB (NUDIX family)
MHPHDDSVAYRFCPTCAGALESRLLKAGEPERLVCVVCGYVFYLDPKVAVGTIIEMGTQGGVPGGIVLVRRAIDPGYGRWVFPGGYVDRGEQVHAAAIREAREECGLEIELDRLINVYSYPGRAPIILVYSAQAISGVLSTDDEGLEVRVFEPADIPWNDLAFRSTREALRDYLVLNDGSPVSTPSRVGGPSKLGEGGSASEAPSLCPSGGSGRPGREEREDSASALLELRPESLKR